MSFLNPLKSQARELQTQRTGQDALFGHDMPHELAQRIVGQPSNFV